MNSFEIYRSKFIRIVVDDFDIRVFENGNMVFELNIYPFTLFKANVICYSVGQLNKCD